MMMCLTSFIPGITGNIIVESGTVLDDIVYYRDLQKKIHKKYLEKTETYDMMENKNK